MKVCLNLFSGLGGFSAAFDDSPEWEVVTVDLDPEDRFDPDLKADMLELTPADLLEAIGYDREEIDVLVVLAGHPCTLFSTAGNHDEWDLDAKKPDGDRARRHTAMLFHTLGLIRALAPDYWYLENPRRSRARIKPYYEVRHDLRKIIDWLDDLEQMLNNMEWQAAGGIGTGSRERAVESIDSQIGNLQCLREQVEELPDPREVRPDFEGEQA